ncbi:MAG: hypothetical protein Q7U75_05995 [Desulfobacterales bacterium]|nr:hypothetical protein [Desulfobacterales bacterium]
MTIRQAMSAMLALALLAGCKVETQHEVFVSELRDVVSGVQAEGEIKSTFRVSTPTMENCERYRPQITAIFARYHDGVSPGECVRADQFVNITFIATSRIMKFDAPTLPGKNVFSLGVRQGPSADTMHLFGLVDRARLAQLQTEIRAIGGDVAREVITFELITMVLNNDTGGTVQLQAPSAFINREPALTVNLDVPRRSRLEMRLSDVAAAQLGRTGQVFVAIMVQK